MCNRRRQDIRMTYEKYIAHSTADQVSLCIHHQTFRTVRIAVSGCRQYLDAIGEAWARGDREAAAAAVSSELIDATAIAGTAADCRAKIAAYRDSGLDLPILSPFARGANSKAVFEEVIRACAPEA